MEYWTTVYYLYASKYASKIESINIAKMQTISNEAAEKIKSNQRAIGRLMALFNKSSFTIVRWIDDKDMRLTMSLALLIIKEETGLSESEILEQIAA